MSTGFNSVFLDRGWTAPNGAYNAAGTLIDNSNNSIQSSDIYTTTANYVGVWCVSGVPPEGFLDSGYPKPVFSSTDDMRYLGIDDNIDDA